MMRIDMALMASTSNVPTARPPGGATTGAQPSPASPTTIPADVVNLSELPANARRAEPIVDAQQAMTVQAPVLQRPVLMVHGLAQRADTFATMKLFLCSEPANPFGGVFDTAHEGQFVQEVSSKTPDAKVFAIDISDNLAAPRVVANEIRRAIDAITAATGAPSVDLITHSMGALVAREAIRQGETRVGNLVMISPPNHGTAEATLASTLHDTNIYEHYPPELMGAMDALRLELGPRGGVNNEWLHGLNEWWAANPNRPRSVVITGIGIPTPDISPTGTSPGDGMVAARRAPLDGADFILAVPNKLPAEEDCFRDFQDLRYNHLQIVSEPEIHREVARFLSAAPTPGTPSQPAGAIPPGSMQQPPMAQFPTPQPGLPSSPATGTAAIPSALPAATTPPNLAGYLSQMQNRTRDLRSDLVASEINRQSFQTWQRNGTYWAAAGTGLTALGLAAASSSPALGLTLMAVGGISMVSGALTAVKNAHKLNDEVAHNTRAAEEALTLADELAHRVLQEQQKSPTA